MRTLDGPSPPPVGNTIWNWNRNLNKYELNLMLQLTLAFVHLYSMISLGVITSFGNTIQIYSDKIRVGKYPLLQHKCMLPTDWLLKLHAEQS